MEGVGRVVDVVSTSVALRVPDTVEMPPPAGATASVTDLATSPVITAASLAPLIVMLMICWVPSAVCTVTWSTSGVLNVLRASTAGSALLSV